VKHSENIGLRDLAEGFLFSLRAEGKSNGTIEYYTYLLHPLLSYASEHAWPDSVLALDTHRLREFLTWTGTRTFELKVANNGGKIVRKAKPSTAWPYYRALRRFLNWAIEEGYLNSNPLSTIHFKQPPAPPVEGYTRDELQLRHTAALQYLRGARDSFLLQLFLRHEDLTMSRRYTHRRP